MIKRSGAFIQIQIDTMFIDEYFLCHTSGNNALFAYFCVSFVFIKNRHFILVPFFNKGISIPFKKQPWISFYYRMGTMQLKCPVAENVITNQYLMTIYNILFYGREVNKRNVRRISEENIVEIFCSFWCVHSRLKCLVHSLCFCSICTRG